MLVIPAIDIIDGKCVRLNQGNYLKMKKYSTDPLEIAIKFKKQGAKLLHVIDLDGARIGKPINVKKIIEIAKTTGLDIQTGGGIRTKKDAEKVLKSGIKRIILGTSAMKNTNMIRDLISKFGEERVAVSIDVKDGKIMVKGWTEKSKISLNKILEKLREAGLKILIFTDVKKDGMLNGIDLKRVKGILESGFRIIIAGGITTNEDIKKIEANN